MEKKVKLNEEQVKSIVTESVKRILKEGFFSIHRPRPEGMPEKLSDVLKADGWKGVKVSGDANDFTIRLYRDSDSFLGYDEPLPFEEMVEEVEIFYRDIKHIPCTVQGDSSGKGSFIRIIKK